jgi:thiol-disulfide isomerase/thioredoxin
MSKILFICALFCAPLCQAQNAKIIKLPDLQKLMADRSQKIHVINFWATWCAPCVKELPLFEKIAAARPDVKVTLVSMDLDLDPNPEKVYKFAAKKRLKSQVLLLDEQDPNSWIDKIDKKWSGALPATIVLNPASGERIFIERSLREGELELYVEELQ